MKHELFKWPLATVREKEAIISDLCQCMYSENRAFRPLFPWVFVRVIDKEQTTASGLVLPETEQNKTVHEGIVVATWQPFVRELTQHHKGSGKECTRAIKRESQFEIGQHILFPHWAGLPIAGFDVKHYRVVKECDWNDTGDGGAFAEVEYSPVHTKAKQQLRELLIDIAPGAEQAFNMDRDTSDLEKWASTAAAKIEERFLLIDREAKSCTLSGR